jgi:Tfp pilus assembly protein PilO
VKQRKPMPRGAILVLIIVGALLVAFVGYTVVVKPKKAEAAKLNKQADADEATIQQYVADAATQKANVAPKIRVADVYRLARAMPSVENLPDILIELNDVANAAGIDLTSISPATPTAGNGMQIVPINIQFTGDYYSVTDLLYRLRTLVVVRHGQLEATGRLFAVKDVSLTPTEPASMLTATVSLETYVYGSGAVAAPPAATPAPTDTTATTSTDTTSTETTPTDTTASASAEGAP